MSNQAITYKDLVLVIGDVAAAIYEFAIHEKANNHGSISLTAILDDKKKENVIHNSNVIFGIYYSNDEQPYSLFQGIITYLNIETSGDVYFLKIEAKTSTYFMDFYPQNRSFQDMTLTSHQLIEYVLKEIPDSQSINDISNERINELVMQYEETNWEFLVRFVSRYGVRIFTYCNDLKIKLQIGLSQVVEEVNWDDLPYRMYQDMELFNFIKENNIPEATQWDYIRYIILSDDIVNLGSKVIYQKREMYIGKINRYLILGSLVNEYTLYFAEGLKIPKYYNPNIIGTSTFGTVSAINRNKIQLKLDIDGDRNQLNTYWFPYSSVAASSDGSGWYSMPAKGDQVRIFFPSSNEKEAYSITYVQGDKAAGSPTVKYISTQNKELKFTNDGIQISANGSSGLIELKNDGTIIFKCIDKLSLHAVESIILNAEENLTIIGDTSINMTSDSGASISILNEETRIIANEIMQN